MKKYFLLPFITLTLFQVYAQNRSETSFSGLYGQGFWSHNNLDDKWNRTTLTLEHANGWRYGDNYTFIDLYDPGKPETQDYYFEWHSRFYADKLIKLNPDNRVIKHIGLATQINLPPSGNIAYLVGPLIDFKMPGAIYFQTSWMIRETPELEGVAIQNTTAFRWWFGKKLNYDNSNGALRRFFIGGFIDFKTSEGVESAWIIFQPQLLMHFNTFSFGTELFVYINKFGVKGKNEAVPQIMARWAF